MTDQLFNSEPFEQLRGQIALDTDNPYPRVGLDYWKELISQYGDDLERIAALSANELGRSLAGARYEASRAMAYLARSR